MTAPRIMVALSGPPGQGSFNESGFDGAMRARAAGVLTGAWMGEAAGWVGSGGEPVEGVRFWALMPDGPVT